LRAYPLTSRGSPNATDTGRKFPSFHS
jgi:hypothetical protein